MSKRDMRHALFGSAVLLSVATVLVMAAAVAADTGAPTNPATTTTETPAPPVPPWRDPKNLTLRWVVSTEQGPVCKSGDESGKSCHYVPFPGTVIQVYTTGGKLLHAYTSGKTGLVTVLLPKGKSQVRISHPPVGTTHYGSKTMNMTAPLFHAPGAKYDFVFSY
jgi:hypothetical protein